MFDWSAKTRTFFASLTLGFPLSLNLWRFAAGEVRKKADKTLRNLDNVQLLQFSDASWSTCLIDFLRLFQLADPLRGTSDTADIVGSINCEHEAVIGWEIFSFHPANDKVHSRVSREQFVHITQAEDKNSWKERKTSTRSSSKFWISTTKPRWQMDS